MTLQCPQCNGEIFNQVQVGRFDKEKIDFKTILPPQNPTVAYVCAQCGFPLDQNTINARKLLVIITGNSDGYKRRAMFALGLEPAEWEEFTRIDNIFLVTKDAWKKQSELLEKALRNTINDVIDVSDGKTEVLKELNKAKD